MLLALSSIVQAANTKYSLAPRTFTDGSNSVWAIWICDTEASMPTGAGVVEGHLGYAIDTNVLKYYDGSSWQAVDGGGGGGGLTHQQVMARASYGGIQ